MYQSGRAGNEAKKSGRVGITALRLISMTHFWLRTLTHINFNHVNKIETRLKNAELKREVERGSTFTLTSDLSCIAYILFANVNFTYVPT